MRILVADDEIGMGNSAPDKLVSRLIETGHEVIGLSTSPEAQDLILKEKWDIAIIDLRWQREGDRTGAMRCTPLSRQKIGLS